MSTDLQRLRLKKMLAKAEGDETKGTGPSAPEAADAVAALVTLVTGQPTDVDHALLARHADALEAGAKRIVKALGAWRKHY